MSSATFVVVGGGIAGVTCVENLSFYAPSEKVILLTASPLIKTITELVPISRMVTSFSVTECDVESLKKKHLNLSIVYDKLKKVISKKNIILTESGQTIEYKYLCICTGGVPNIIPQAFNNSKVLGIRDTDSVEHFRERLKQSKRILIVGNGGIASELVYATEDVEIIWVIKDKYISSTFIDPGAAEFFRTSSNFSKSDADKKIKGSLKRIKYTEDHANQTHPATECRAAALGPDWLKDKHVSGDSKFSLQIVYETQIVNILDTEGDWPLRVELSNGNVYNCDLVISATGVKSLTQFECDGDLKLGADGGIAVDWRMETSIKNMFAAGDVASAEWILAPHWFQMRLWTQAYHMGAMAAKSMHAYLTREAILQDFCFELFSHTTKLFGYQIVLLGNFNGQGLGTNYEILIRSTPDVEYIKFVLVNNKLQGAILIGETGLEETCENLILNQLDLSPYGDDILNPDIDIEDYFD